MFNHGGGSLQCQACPSDHVQTSDGFSCIPIKSTTSQEGCKDCNFVVTNNLAQCINGFLSDYNQKGVRFESRACVPCDLKQSIVTESGCQSCRARVVLEDNTTVIEKIECDQVVKNQLGGLFFTTPTRPGQPSYFSSEFESTDEEIDSWVLKEYGPASFRACSLAEDKRNDSACQNLANLCALDLYREREDTDDVCSSFFSTNTQVWLEYVESLSDYRKEYSQIGITATNQELVKLRMNLNNQDSLVFWSAEFDLGGQLTRLGELRMTQLQLCSQLGYSSSTRSPFSLADINVKCSVKAKELFDLSIKSNSVLFYDLFIKYKLNSTVSDLFPLPVRIGQNSNQLKRRFFLLDPVSSMKSSNDYPPQYIRYAKSILIKFELLSSESATIYPPLVTIEYDYVSRDELDKTIDISFRVEYQMSIQEISLVFYILVGSLSGLGLFWSMLRTWNWNRRSSRYGVELLTLFKFLMFLVGSTANAILLSLLAISIYLLIFYRAQGYAYLFLPTVDQERVFVILLLVAFGLKLVDIFYIVCLQSSYDIFFVDWERPKLTSESSVAPKVIKSFREAALATNRQANPANMFAMDTMKKEEANKTNKVNDLLREQVTEQSKVSCWRTLFVANEWNELQVYRKLKTSLTLIGVLFFMKVVNLEDFARRDQSDSSSSHSEYSTLLRIAIAGSIYIALGVTQWLWFTLIYERFFQDKLGQFVDFCSVSNISMFIMTHAQYGFYIHGRSPHGQSDTSLQQMTAALTRERFDLSTRRGLQPHSDHQVFSISVFAKLVVQYGKVMQPIYHVSFIISRCEFNLYSDYLKKAKLHAQQQKQLGAQLQLDSEQFDKKMVAYTQLNRFLMSFIENVINY